MSLIKLNLYPLLGRSQNCSIEILSALSTLIFDSTLKPLSKPFIRPDWHILRKLVASYEIHHKARKLKGNLPIGQLLSHTSKKATKAIFLQLSGNVVKSTWLDAIVVSTNTHSIGSDCHWLFISGHEEITSDYRRYYPPGTQWRMLHVMCHVGETLVKLYSYDVIICHIWSTYQRILAFSHSVRASH